MNAPLIRAGDFPYFPRIFLAGAPRCGSTSISKFLSRHPQVCFSRPKEVFYFNHLTDESLPRIREEYLDRYFSHFDPNQHLVLGEGSVSYLYQPEVIERIVSMQPEARFILAVRNPIDMLRSYHHRLLFLLEEDQPDFARAWELQDERARGERVPRMCGDPKRLLYREVASFGKHIERLVEIVGRERCHIVVQDDIKDRAHEVSRDLLRFVGVEDDIDAVEFEEGRSQFPHRMQSKSYRWRWLQTLLYKPPVALFKAAERNEIKRGVRPFGLKRLHKRLVKFNRVMQAPESFSPQLRARLRDAFAEDIDKLGAILERDLSHWK
jgi:hypothetical protein